jgi:hypothetical protein
MSTNERRPGRLAELVESANGSDVMDGAPLTADECEVLFDYGWTHALNVVTRGFYLVEVKNTGWAMIEDLDEAMKLGEDF